MSEQPAHHDLLQEFCAAVDACERSRLALAEGVRLMPGREQRVRDAHQALVDAGLIPGRKTRRGAVRTADPVVDVGPQRPTQPQIILDALPGKRADLAAATGIRIASLDAALHKMKVRGVVARAADATWFRQTQLEVVA